MNQKRFNDLKKRAEDVKATLAVLQGKRQAYMTRLKELGFNSVDEAKVFLEVKEKEHEVKEIELNKALDEYEHKIKEAEECLQNLRSGV